MALWIAGAERITSGRSGATYREPRAPWRFVFHTMEAPEDDPRTSADEGWDLAQLKRYIASFPYPPHLWAYPEANWVGQCVPLDLSAYALRHESGDPETNHKHAIQVEILDFASDTPCIDHAAWLGRRVIGPVRAAGIPLNLSHLAASTGSDGYGENGKVRMSWSQWAAFDGICGHANVPGNSHWDPGLADYRAIAQAATGEDMALDAADKKAILDIVRGESKRLAQYLALGEGNQAFPNTERWPSGITNPKMWNEFGILKAALGALPDKIADAVVAALPAGSVDAAVVKAAVKEALREGTGT